MLCIVGFLIYKTNLFDANKGPVKRKGEMNENMSHFYYESPSY